MVAVADLPNVATIDLPRRFDTDLSIEGLQLQRLVHPGKTVTGTASAYRSRGTTCRRVLLKEADGPEYIVELASFREDYDARISGVIRASSASVEDNRLNLNNARFKDDSKTLEDAARVRDDIHRAWASGIRYRREITGEDGDVVQDGLRLPQLGAMHAIASHWTLGGDPAMVVMPTGTGKTEVMIAATVAAQCDRVLVIVPTDALRSQTANKFATYGLLSKIGVIDPMDNPVVATLSSRPTRAYFAAIRACNVLVTTMSSVGLADPVIQAEFAGLFSHIFFDEAHHIEAATWRRFRSCSDHAHTLLFTATPFREDSKPIEGKIIYNFPLSAAQEQGYFGTIRFLEVFEPNADQADASIAATAVARLREDLANGHDHIMMARTASIDAAERLFRTIYSEEHADLNPVLLHSRSTRKRETLERIRAGEHRIIVCVDMFGEGFDLPNLKVAALHAVHKSIGITLQFVGRFARTREGVAAATFVANVAEDGVPEALENLYQEDPDWGLILADLSYDAIDPQARLSELAANLRNVAGDEDLLAISTLALRPKISAQVYRTDAFNPERYAQAFRANQHIYQPQISHQDNLLVLVVNQRETLDWTDSRDIETDSWHLYMAYYDPERQLLYCHSSKKGNATESLAKAVSNDPALIQGEEVFKTFARLRRLTLHAVGLTSRSRNVRYQMFAGIDVRNAIDPVLQQDKMKSNITGVGYENGKRRTVGGSRKGKIWSMSSGSLANWKTWCDEIGTKLIAPNLEPNDFLRYTLVPTIVDELPDIPALMIDWPDQLFESSNFRFDVTANDGSTSGFHDCQLDLIEWESRDAFRFELKAGEDSNCEMELRIIRQEGAESSYDVRRTGGAPFEVQAAGQSWDIAAFFNANPPLVRLADGSQLSGNILLRPREELADTYERDQIRTLDWTGVDFARESWWRNGAERENSIQERFIRHLEAGLATFIIDDDDTGESADVVSIEETPEEIIVYLWHCKYSGGAEPGQRIGDLYEVCGQAQKSVKWTWSLNTLVKHLVERESNHLRGRPSRFIRGSTSELVALRKSSRRRFVSFRVGIVQPGLSRQNVPTDHLAVIGSTNTFIQTVTDNSLVVYGSD